ncbi:ABC transporter permease [Devosia sp. J2-20]|uniref:ABC transporter permease n=1 Tax=Devosia sp. J2-20 TaxID=3026161 RepID=UPI00249AE8BD|nr:ABC transporter permease [Devosia sp. J2-20]WDQ98841.1 ABC transporter permease [Devosia sp. J2-20]
MKRFAGWTLASPATALVVVFLVLPVLATIATTFTTPAGPFATYVSFFGSGFRRTVLVRTIQISLITTAIALVIGFVTAYVVSRAPSWLKSILIVAAVFPLLTGVVVRSFAWLIILGKNGILNSTLLNLGLISEPFSMLYTQGAVIVAMVYLFVPLMILTLVGVLESIPEDLVQASSSLGAKPIATFMQVTLPLAVPGLIVGAVLVFTGSFTSYATPQLLGGEQVMMMGTLMYQQAMVTFDWVVASTIAAVMVVITIAIVLVMTRLARHLNPMAV